MGTDIHGVWQRKRNDKWEDIESEFEQDRHYQLFAVLADVRNGYGFAGCITGESIKPISKPRGMPAGFELVVSDEYGGDVHPIASVSLLSGFRRSYYKDGEPLEVWMGDHSHSYLTGEEMLLWYATAPTVVKTGIISRKQYESWDGASPPGEYCGGISGPQVFVVNDNKPEMQAIPKWTHVRIQWNRSLHEELKYFFDEVQRLVNEHGEIRFVFGFDS